MPDTLTLIVVPHTHWDREWYQTFQQFRMRLVRCVDHVLRVLADDPDFRHFMLDAQTIVLDDYLEVKPERAGELRELALSGRLPVGPWYIQPDEFLVGGEAIIRNLLLGRRLAEPYGGAMLVGYAPDCFGHSAQMPQIWQGFGIDNAVFMRGVGPEIDHSEFWWEAPDGTRVCATYLCGEWGYGNAQSLPLTTDELVAKLEHIVAPMLPKATTPYILLMNGSDHLEPQDGLPEALARAGTQLAERGWQLRLGTLAQYIDRVRESVLAGKQMSSQIPSLDLQTYRGEFRSSFASHLLPSVLSSRIWIKQRNAASEELLVRWAEPFTAWAAQFGAPYPAGLIHLAWRFLLQNQPHDSICGCSIDQVHREMLPRFDQADQIATQVIDDALRAIADQIDTTHFAAQANAVVATVFNPLGWRRDAVADVTVQVTAPADQLVVVDPAGVVVPHVAQAGTETELIHATFPKELVESTLTMLDGEGRVMGYRMLGSAFGEPDEQGTVSAWLAVALHGPAESANAQVTIDQLRALIGRPDVQRFEVRIVESPRSHLTFLARDLPPHGGRAFQVRPRQPEDPAPPSELHTTANTLENAHLRVAVSASGTLTVIHKATGLNYADLLQLEDGGDVGDSYTYSQPPEDLVVRGFAAPPVVTLAESSPLQATLRIAGTVDLPAACAANRQARTTDRVACPVVHEVSLEVASHVVTVRTTVTNLAHDHRLRVLFPTPIQTEMVDAEGAFMVNRRPVQVTVDPQVGRRWPEDPVATYPQKRFVAVSDGARGLAVLNRGLPEYEALPGPDGVTLALTLLRCTGWLSRDDFATRRGQAGPQLATPEGQMEGTWTLEYAIMPLRGVWQAEDGAAQRAAHAFNAPVRTVVTGHHTGSLAPTWSFIRLEPAGLVLSAVKRAEDGNGLMVRWYNPLEHAVEAELVTMQPFAHAELSRLDETRLHPLDGVSADPGQRWRVLTPSGAIMTARLVPMSQ